MTYTDFERRLDESLSGSADLAAAIAAIEEYTEPLVRQAEDSKYTRRAAEQLEEHLERVQEAVKAASLHFAEAKARQLLAPIAHAVARSAAVRERALRLTGKHSTSPEPDPIK